VIAIVRSLDVLPDVGSLVRLVTRTEGSLG
jgi:hypothetical protein